MRQLSASKVGFPCLRHLWYASRGEEEAIPEKTKRIFEAGSLLERLVVSFMERDGYFVIYNSKSHQDDPDFKIQLDGGVLTGRHDIIFRHKQEKPPLILGDIKTMNTRAFTLWRRYGTIKKYPQYVQQLMVYYVGLTQEGHELANKLAIIGFNKDNSQYAIDYFPIDMSVWENIKARCEYVFSCQEPPEPEKEKPAWACSYCGYKHICPLVKIQRIEDEAEEVNDADVELAAYMLEEARKLRQEANELEKEAKAVLEKLKDKEKVKAGNYLITITPFRSTRIDSKALKEKMPEVYNAFVKEVVSYRYNVKTIEEVG